MAKKKRNIKNWLKESMFILIPAALVFGTFTVVIKPAVVSGNSMNDTYQNGDHLLLWRHAEPKKCYCLQQQAGEGSRKESDCRGRRYCGY